MKHSTLEDAKPSDQTLSIIRQIAYTYRIVKATGKVSAYCLN